MALLQEITFVEDLPPALRNNRRFKVTTGIVKLLREKPNEWAHVETIKKSGYGSFRTYCKRHGIDHEFEFACRRDDVQGGYLVYARWVPEANRVAAEKPKN